MHSVRVPLTSLELLGTSGSFLFALLFFHRLVTYPHCFYFGSIGHEISRCLDVWLRVCSVYCMEKLIASSSRCRDTLM